MGAAPLRVRFQADVKLDVEETGRIRAVIGPAQFRGNRGYLGKGAQYLAYFGGDLGRFIERDGVWHRGAHPQRAFVQLRHELSADGGDQQQRTCQENSRGERRPPGMGQTKIKTPGVSRLDGFEGGVTALAHALAHEPRTKHRQQRQRYNQGADQRENHGVSHRFEQRAGGSGQHVNRQEAGHDDCDRVEQRAINFRGRSFDDLYDVERSSTARGDLAENILHHEYRAIHQYAEIHRSNGEQIGRGTLKIEANKGEQQRQRDGDRDNETRTKIVEKKYQDHEHQQHAPQQVALHGLGRQRD